MIYCVAIGTFTGFVFLVALLFVAGNITEVIASPAGPLLQILYNATSSRAGAICLLMFPLVCTVFATIAIMTTSSRMVSLLQTRSTISILTESRRGPFRETVAFPFLNTLDESTKSLMCR